MIGIEHIIIAWLWVVGGRVVYILTAQTNRGKPAASEAVAIYLAWPLIWTWVILKVKAPRNV